MKILFFPTDCYEMFIDIPMRMCRGSVLFITYFIDLYKATDAWSEPRGNVKDYHIWSLIQSFVIGILT